MQRAELYDLHYELCERALELMRCKNSDYADGDDPFRNLHGSYLVGVEPKRAVLVRLCDKLSRLATFVQHGDLQVKDESVEDTLLDVINYAVLLAGMMHDEKLAATETLGGATAPKSKGCKGRGCKPTVASVGEKLRAFDKGLASRHGSRMSMEDLI